MRVHVLTRRGESPDGDRGAVALLVALMMVTLLVLVAFAVDIGNAYAQSRQLSVAADADVLAAAAEVGAAMPPGVACTQSVLNSLTDDNGNVGATAIATATADAINTANNKTGTSEPVKSVTVTCADDSAVEVRVETERSVPTVFAGIIGIDELGPSSYAVARYVRIRTAGGLRPWAVCDATVAEAQKATDTTFWTGIDKIHGPCDTDASGIWGSVDFDGGGNPAGPLAEWTLNGYPGPVEIPSTIPADPGVTNSAGVRAALQSLIGQVVLFPSVEGHNGGGGNNASFDTVGIATVRVCGIEYGNNTYKLDQTTGLTSDCWVPPVPPTTSTSTDIETTGPFTTTTSAAIANNGTTLQINTPPDFPAASTDPDVDITVSVSIPGAGPGGKDLDTEVATFTSTAEVEIADKVKNAVPLGTDITFTVVTATTTTTTTSGGVPPPSPGPYEVQGNKLQLLDHIQFRWVGYTTTSYNGVDAATCDFTDRRCVGATVLWQ